MSDITWNPWKLTTIGILVVLATALVTGVVVAHYVGMPDTQQMVTANAPNAPGAPNVPSAANAPSAPAAAPAAEPHRKVAARPSTAVIEDCNQYARSHSSTEDTVKDAIIGGAAGAGLGAAGGAIAGGGSGAGKGAGIGGLLGVAAGTLYGINDANQHDNRMADAYRACMHRRGYTD